MLRLILIEDTLMVSEAYGDSTEAALKNARQVPKHDPAPLAALIAAATTRLGGVATRSTLAYPPFMLARLLDVGPYRRWPLRLEHRHLGYARLGGFRRPVGAYRQRHGGDGFLISTPCQCRRCNGVG